MQVTPTEKLYKFFIDSLEITKEKIEEKESELNDQLEDIFNDSLIDIKSAELHLWDVYCLIFELTKREPIYGETDNNIDMGTMELAEDFVPIIYAYLSRDNCNDYEYYKPGSMIVRKKSKL